MKLSIPSSFRSTAGPRVPQIAGIRIALALVVALLLGFAAGAFWRYRSAKARPASPINAEAAAGHTPAFCDGTKAVLKDLESPVEIRFYSLLDPASASASLQAFARRVDRLLLEYERAGHGLVKVDRVTALTDTNIDAALSDGIRVFNLDKGGACYLGIVVLRDKQKETIAQLSERWEPALEFDLSRAIAAVSKAAPALPAPAKVSADDVAEVQKLMRSKPALASASLEQGIQMLRQSALADFTAVVNETQTQLKAAEQRFKDAQNANSEAEQLAARKQILQIQAEQTAKLQDIGAHLQKEIAAFEGVKGASR